MARDNKNNKRYTKEEKESLVQRMLPAENISTSLLSINIKRGYRTRIFKIYTTTLLTNTAFSLIICMSNILLLTNNNTPKTN